MNEGSWGVVVRWLVAALACALPVASGCGDDSGDSPGKKSALCAPDACERAAPCGCEGMDPACSCELCQLAGECQLVDGVCAPASADDCNHPNGACETYGACQLGSNLSGAACVPVSDDDCHASELCVKYGSCSTLADFPGCWVNSDDDCAASVACKDLGCCTLIEGQCSRSDGSCPSKCCGDEPC